MDFLQGLNPQQREAVSHVEGPLLILAGAGSGKTRVITHRIAHLIDKHGVPAAAVLAVTFTNKAAGEMRERVARLLGDRDAAGPGRWSPPFTPSACGCCGGTGDPLASLRPGFTRNFTIYDEDDQLALVKAVYRHARAGREDSCSTARRCRRISHAKNHKQTPQDLYQRRRPTRRPSKLAVVYEQYEGRLRQANALDFDDLLLEAVRLLQHDEATREPVQPALRVPDDRRVSGHQPQPVRADAAAHRGPSERVRGGRRGPVDLRLARRRHPQHPRFREGLPERAGHPAGAELPLDQEHPGGGRRGGGAQHGAQGQEALDRGRRRARRSACTRRRTPRTRRCSSPTPSSGCWPGNPATRVAVLYRTNFQSRQIEEALRRYGRKYLVVGGFSFYQRAEVKDVLAYLKAADLAAGLGQPAAHPQHAGARASARPPSSRSSALRWTTT